MRACGLLVPAYYAAAICTQCGLATGTGCMNSKNEEVSFHLKNEEVERYQTHRAADVSTRLYNPLMSPRLSLDLPLFCQHCVQAVAFASGARPQC